MQSLGRTFEFFIAVSLLAVATWGGGLVYGRYSNRWSVPAQVAPLADKIVNFPQQIGPWKCTQEHDIDPAVLDILDAQGMIERTYQHDESEAVIRMFLLVGPPGQTSVHTPEICFPSGEYRMVEERSIAKPLESTDDTLWSVDFEETDVYARRVRVYYGWQAAGSWRASVSPRWEYGGEPALVKVQIATYLPRRDVAGQRDAGFQFLQSFIPQYQQHVTNTSPN